MAHSQRQKKRSSQFKKKHFEAKGRTQSEGGGKKEEHSESSALQNKAPQQQGGARREEKRDGSPVSGLAVEKAADHHVQGDSRSEDSRKYSRRKLASNWDRYDRSKSLCPSLSYCSLPFQVMRRCRPSLQRQRSSCSRGWFSC